MKKLFRIPLWLWLLFVLAGVGYAFHPYLLEQLNQLEQKRLMAQPQPQLSSMPQRLDFDRQMADLTYLASDELAGRGTGQPGGAKAQQWLVAQFTDMALLPAGTQGYVQPYQPTTGKAQLMQGAANVLGRIEGSEPQLPMLVLTAHYDHLGLHQGQIYFGADDNASGVAALLAMARYFKQHPPRHTVLFAALDNEETGMWGARMLFEQELLKPEQIKLNINMDMLSHDTDKQLIAVGSYHYPELEQPLLQLQQQSSVRLLLGYDRPAWRVGTHQDWTYSSDHREFHKRAVPFVYFGVPDHADYHQPTDTVDNIDLEFYRQVSETVLDAVLLFDAS
jgi:hypothetical protein